MKIPEYTEELHMRLTYLLDIIDPAHIANNDPLEYYNIVGYALALDDSLDLITAINESFAESLDDSYKLKKEESEFIIENL